MDIGVLGSVEAWHDGVRLPVGPPMQRCVLAVLALRAGDGVPVDRLAEVLWGEDPPGDARGLIHNYVSRLRKALRPAGVDIARRPPGYALDVDPDRVDVHRFRDLVSRAHRAGSDETAARALTEGLSLWRGEPLAGTTGAEALDRLRTGLAEEQLVASEKRAEVVLRLGRQQEILGELVELSAEHPLREKLVSLTMLALYSCGRQAEALGRYDETRRVLAEQLGLDPGDELRRTHERILRAETTPAAEPESRRRPNSLPFDVPGFVGRQPELERLVTGARAGRTIMISAIDGMAGVGKTALAVHAARRLAPRYPDAQLFVDLHGFTPDRDPVEPAAALDALLRSLGVPADRIPAGLDQRVLVWRTEMADREALLVLDNAVDADQVRHLIPGAPGCLVLVTSRRRMPALNGAVPLSLDVLSEAEATALFTGIVGERATSAPEEVARLVEVCGRLPLAVRIAATRLQHRPRWTVADLVDRMRTERTRLPGPDADHDIAVAFALSYRYLKADQQRTFRLLGAHPGTDFDPPAVAALTGTPVSDTRDVLELLVDHHLLEQPATGRYTFHDLLRHHALALVATDPERPTAVHRLLDYYLHVTTRATDLLQPGRRQLDPPVTHVPDHVPDLRDNKSAMSWYATENRNLLAAIRHAGRHGFDEHLVLLPRNVGHYLVINHHVEDLMAIQEPAAEAAHRLGDLAAESRSVYHLALTNYMSCRYRTGLGHAARCLAMARELGDESGESWTLGVMGLLHYRLGDLVEALDEHRTAMGIQQRLGDDRGQAICTANAGRTELVLGNAVGARPLLEEALALSRKIGDVNEEASNLTTLGTVHSGLGDPDTAIRYLSAGLELAREAGNADYTVRGLVELADGLRRAGRASDARDQARQALHLLGHGRSPDHLAEAHNAMGAICLSEGDETAAADHHRQALDLAQRIEYRLEHAHALNGISAATGDAEYRARALAHYEAMGIPGARPVG
ncbi:AfsR/SARP family transcriptional regulator [Umezawaea tangerina]|uniref:DNA-binding SARP family transcriptional activator n=1 Tax=Umezawaea tangerina TaxID=84725 RepID=A0A2T0T6R6_9PSEU|nr:BTAD domain-containing putative transcriptional regulator [Umezawaea tangerina]PRY41354.1 DNA-binding SARP family transcriptional activator [Umezawaea tangerina]